VPDGVFEGTAILEDAGHGYGDFEITATVTIKKDTCHIAIKSPPQIPYFINSYEGQLAFGRLSRTDDVRALPPPYNEGLYRCVSLDFGPKGTLCNAVEPAPHMNCTTTPMETLTDAVRLAFEKAMPSKVAASWGHANGFNMSRVGTHAPTRNM
jgi:N-methylhydantoinase B